MKTFILYCQVLPLRCNRRGLGVMLACNSRAETRTRCVRPPFKLWSQFMKAFIVWKKWGTAQKARIPLHQWWDLMRVIVSPIGTWAFLHFITSREKAASPDPISKQLLPWTSHQIGNFLVASTLLVQMIYFGLRPRLYLYNVCMMGGNQQI